MRLRLPPSAAAVAILLLLAVVLSQPDCAEAAGKKKKSASKNSNDALQTKCEQCTKIASRFITGMSSPHFPPGGCNRPCTGRDRCRSVENMVEISSRRFSADVAVAGAMCNHMHREPRTSARHRAPCGCADVKLENRLRCSCQAHGCFLWTGPLADKRFMFCGDGGELSSYGWRNCLPMEDKLDF